MSGDSSANVARFLLQRAREQPEGCAVMAPNGRIQGGQIRYESLSFAELQVQSGKVAHGLRASGIGPGQRVLLMVKPGSDLIRCCFALFKVGAVPVVIDPGMGLKSFLSCVERTRPAAILGVPLAQWISRLFYRKFHSVEHRIVVGRGFKKWYESFSAEDYPIKETRPDELAAILFTSGSTGAPKGVCYGHGQFDAQVRLIRDTFSIEPGEVDLPMLPVFALFNPALGMTTVVPELNPGKPATVEPAKILQAINQCGVTNSFGSPVLWKKIAAYAATTGQTFPGMRRILMAGAPVPPQLVRRLQPHFPNARIWSPYGATECLPVSAVDGETILREAKQSVQSGAGTCVGKPVSEVQIQIIRITDSVIATLEKAELLPAGEIGEIIATGPSVTKSYDGLPEATARAKIRDGEGRLWHRMGDAGYFDASGQLWFCGRIAERVMTREGPMYTDRCEGIFNTIPGVSRSALIGLGEAPCQVPAIVIEPEKGMKPSEWDILKVAKDHEVTRPIEKVFFYSSFPVDVRHNAKIHRLTLSKRFQEK
ncbi:AMP-binding protein [Puniceicoccales bacterium CK1056]|uniref:AMP-binding protein n=1 Tax=Oceanipulchritudo coccoides TaxID=2706888 RepID=A0A6B2LZC7_9BACT|nr:fatty acid CoA ligase family protein [Oceanipulchritudo coccoides]NDV61416.1 AMP-binding protein [Oceanipulchritudo coccoides]